MRWEYFHPKFEYEEKFQDAGWPWSGHKFFAYDLVANIKPKEIVELGTHNGTSLFSFCQAVKNEALDTRITAVDTWKGDQHAGFYGDEIFKEVNEIKESFYLNLNINLMRMTFDEAVDKFENKSINVLHIDGLHTYEAVRHDFETWIPKVKDDGIILLHDIKVGESNFGVYKLWNELKERYSTIEFYQSFGLGVLFLDKNFGKEFKKKEKKWQMHYSYIHEINKSQEISKKEQEISKKEQEIAVIKSSKFWKLRSFLIKCRKKISFSKLSR